MLDRIPVAQQFGILVVGQSIGHAHVIPKTGIAGPQAKALAKTANGLAEHLQADQDQSFAVPCFAWSINPRSFAEKARD